MIRKTYPQAVHLWGRGNIFCVLFSNFGAICPFSSSYPHLYTQALYTFVDNMGTGETGVTSEGYLVFPTSPEVET